MLNRWTLVEMAQAVRERTVSPQELLEAHLRQIGRLNPGLNAFVTVLEEPARQAARRLEQTVMRADGAGPLAGVPVTVKDSFDVAGLPTLCGSRFRQDHRASADATAVARLRRAGAVLLGKTNTPEFLMNYETDNYITGRTNNPWDPDRTPGGSSGGEAAAIASFCSAGGIGSDGGGSVRIPAHFSGIAALKPTPGRISAAGHFPDICHPGGLLGVAGPMARTARDLRLLFEVLAGYDPEDPFSAPVPLRPANLEGLCVGMMEQFYEVPVQPVLREAVREAARALRELGFRIEEFHPRGLERSPNLWWFFFGRLNAPLIRQLIGDREDQAHWTGIEFMKKAEAEPAPSAVEVVENLAARDKMRSAMLRQMEQCPVLLLPPCGVLAFRHRERRWMTPSKQIGLFEAMMPATPWNLLGFPAVVIPWKLSPEGLPVGIQLVGRPWEEETLLEVAVRLEQARGPLPAPPGCRD
jgi:Asp-tRNA(Asn)/Glu-tRNA(Gln) amidotransferase A subunit family amidase